MTAVTSCVRRKACTLSRAAGAGRGRRGTGAAPYRWVGVIPRTRSGPPRVVTTRGSRGVPGRSCQRIYPLWWTPLVLERGGKQVRAGPAAGCLRRRQEGGAPGRLSVECLAHDGVRGGRPGAVVDRVGRAGAGGRLAHALHEHCDFAHIQVLVRRMQKVERRLQFRHPSWVRGLRLVQVRGRVPGAARPEGVQQGWGAAVEEQGGPCACQP